MVDYVVYEFVVVEVVCWCVVVLVIWDVDEVYCLD